jgi:acylphosphatase
MKYKNSIDNTVGDVVRNPQKARLIVSDTVQNVGCRAFITEKILNTPGLEGGPRNLSDGKVEVLLKGKKPLIENFVKELKTELPKALGMPINPGIHFSDIEYDIHLQIPDTMRTSQGLLVGQLNKGIDILQDFLDEFHQLPKNMAKELKKIM